jgi:hypothetical protein
MRELRQDDFSGGLAEQRDPSAFARNRDQAPTQAAILRGLVLENEVTLRSQWECQRIGTLPGSRRVQDMHLFQGANNAYLVAICTDGTIWWTLEPATTATNATTNAANWVQLSVSTPTSTYRFIAEFDKAVAGSGKRHTLRVHARAGSGTAVDIHESGATLTFTEIADYYPVSTYDEETTVTSFASGKAPRCNGGGKWGDFLVLFDIDFLKNYQQRGSSEGGVTLNALNTQRYPNGMWVTEAIDKTKVDPLSTLFIGSPDAVIVAIVETDSGLLVFTTDAGPESGVFLIRNTAEDPSLEKLHMGLGATPSAASMLQGYHNVSRWPATGSIVWLDRQGRVWNTNGQQAVQLDRHGPTPVATAGTLDHAAAAGRHMFVARGGRMLVFSGYEREGAWCELVAPFGNIRSMFGAEHALYFIADGKVYRYLLANEGGSRGLIDGEAVNLTFGSATYAARSGHDTTYWHEAGLRTTGTGTIVSMSVSDGAALDTNAGSFTTALNTPAGNRQATVVRAHGPSTEVSVVAVVTGDVSIESVSVWYHGGRKRR